MSDKWNSYQWKELRNNDPKKYQFIINNKQYAEKEAEALNREWDRAIDALSRDRSFGRPGDYRMDLHSYKSRNDNYPMGNSQRYDEILYGYEQAEKSARAKKGLDSSIKDEWSGIRSNGVIFNYSDGKYTITHKNGRVETFPGNKFNTVEELFKYIDNIKDSAIKDMPLMFKSNVNMQSLKSNIDNVKNKPNETYINSLNANIQGIIADIEEIKGYEKEGKFNESPALKFSCKNLTAQYYKLLNDPKLQGTLHKLDVPTYKNVLYAEHQAQMLSQVTLKDSAIKDEDYSKYLSIVKQLEKLVEPANRALQQKIAKYGVTKQDIRNNSPKYRDVCREIPELKVWAKLIMQLPGELAGFMPAHPSQESVDKLKKAVTNSKAFDSTIK